MQALVTTPGVYFWVEMAMGQWTIGQMGQQYLIAHRGQWVLIHDQSNFLMTARADMQHIKFQVYVYWQINICNTIFTPINSSLWYNEWRDCWLYLCYVGQIVCRIYPSVNNSLVLTSKTASEVFRCHNLIGRHTKTWYIHDIALSGVRLAGIENVFRRKRKTQNRQ